MIVRRPIAPIRFITRGSLLSLCLLAFLACDARPTWATCGDYLHGSPAKQADINVGMPLGGQDHSPTQVPTCTGPQCQRNQHIPAAPTKTVQVPVSSDAILTVVSALMSADDFSCYQIGDADPITGFASGILRPPQAI